MIESAKRLEGIGEYYFSTKLREIETLNKEGRNIINLGIGSPDLPPHTSVTDELNNQSRLAGTHGYQSYKGALALRQAITTWYNTWYNVQLNADTEVLPLIGSKEGLMHICMAFLNTVDIALIPNPGYPTYSSAVKLSGATPVPYLLSAANEYQPNFEELDRIVQESNNAGQKVKILFLNYPHMPTGQLPLQGLFNKMVQWAKSNDILLVHDNPYSFILNEQPESLLSAEGAMDVALELNSLSKSHNMAGWRVGFLCGNEKYINEVLKFKSNMDSGMFLPLQLAAAKALQLGKEWHNSVNEQYAARKQWAIKIFEKLGCTYNPAQVGLFVWGKVPNGVNNGFELSDQVLYNANVFITPGGIFGSAGNEYIRISLCATEQKLQEALMRIENNL